MGGAGGWRDETEGGLKTEKWRQMDRKAYIEGEKKTDKLYTLLNKNLVLFSG